MTELTKLSKSRERKSDDRLRNVHGKFAKVRVRGVATLELVLLLPVILLFGLASADYGRVVHAYLVVSNAARVGAQYGSMHGFTPFTQTSWENQIRQTIQSEMQGLAGFNAANLQIEIPQPTTDSDGMFSVRIEITYLFQTIVSWPAFLVNSQLHHEVEMRQIR